MSCHQAFQPQPGRWRAALFAALISIACPGLTAAEEPDAVGELFESCHERLTDEWLQEYMAVPDEEKLAWLERHCSPSAEKLAKFLQCEPYLLDEEREEFWALPSDGEPDEQEAWLRKNCNRVELAARKLRREKQRKAAAAKVASTVMVYPLRHPEEMATADVEFLERTLHGRLEELPKGSYELVTAGEPLPADCDEGCAVERAREGGAGHAVVGEVLVLSEGYALSLRLFHVGTGQLLKSESAATEGAVSTLVDPLDEAAVSVRKKLTARQSKAAKKKADKVKGTSAKAERVKRARERARRDAQAKRRQEEAERHRRGSAGLFTLGALFQIGAFGFGFASGYGGEELLLIPAIGCEVLGLAFIIGGISKRAKYNRALRGETVAGLDDGPARTAGLRLSLTPLIDPAGRGTGLNLSASF